MLLLKVGVTRLDGIKKDYIRGSLGIRDLAEKIQEKGLRLLTHIVRKEEGEGTRERKRLGNSN